MTAFDAEAFDVAVIGAGHAGIEAALASARLMPFFVLSIKQCSRMPH